MIYVEILMATLLIFFVVFLLGHAVIHNIEETRVWNRKRVAKRRAERDRKEAEDFDRSN